MADLSLQKRRSGAISGAERITGVKNAMADLVLTKTKQHYDILMKKVEQDIQLEEHKLQNETKLLNLENKRNELEYNKRLYPYADLSSEEMMVANLEKYLVKNTSNLCYTDKSLSNKVRHKASTEVVTPIVAEARSTLVRKEILRAIENNRKKMYNFLDKPVSRHEKKRMQMEKTDHIDEFEKLIQENKLPSFTGHLMPNSGVKNNQSMTNGLQNISLPVVTIDAKMNIVSKKQSGQYYRKSGEEMIAINLPLKVAEVVSKKPAEVTITKTQEVKELLKQNPVLREALAAQETNKSSQESSKPSQALNGILSRMARKKHPTKTQIQQEADAVQRQVETFCSHIEQVLWTSKEEEFQQDLKFIKDKDSAWNEFMTTMQKRNRGNFTDKEQQDGENTKVTKKRPFTSFIPKEPVPEKQKEIILMKNILKNKPRIVESAPATKRGIPHHTAKRSKQHSATAQLQRMLAINKSVIDSLMKSGQSADKIEPGSSGLIVANKIAEVTAV